MSHSSSSFKMKESTSIVSGVLGNTEGDWSDRGKKEGLGWSKKVGLETGLVGEGGECGLELEEGEDM
jgi:hypothetical protein